MADKKISQFDNGGAIQPTDEIATNRGGVNTKVFVGSAAALNTGNDPGDIPTNADLATQFAEIGKVKASSSDNFPSELVNKIIQGSNVSIDLEVDSSGNEYLIINASAGATNLPDGDYGDITVSGSGSVFTIKSDVVDTSNLGGDITAAGKALLDDADAAAQRTTLGLGTVSTQNTGTSGANIPLLNATNTWSGVQSGVFSGRIRLPQSPATTIASGVATIANSSYGFYPIETEGLASTDDLNTITDSGAVTGDIIIIRSNASGRDVTAKDGTGNLVLAGDFILSNTEDTLTLRYSGSAWVEISRSDNGA